MGDIRKIYIGVYGICIKDGKILVIKKGRGPYIGKFDLPGGGLNFDENVEECLTREMFEETSLKVENNKFYCHNEYRCTYENNGEQKDFHHLALYFFLRTENGVVKEGPDGEDSLGAIFVSVSDLTPDNTAPIAYPVIMKAIDTESHA